jgi:hypothetical protein
MNVIPATVVEHLANLVSCMTTRAWSDFGPGWLGRYWAAITAPGAAPGLIEDPFFASTIGSPATPNGVSMPYSEQPPRPEPTSIGPPVDTGSCQFPDCAGDPRAPGRLDQVSFLLERCQHGGDWPWRQAATGRGGRRRQSARPRPRRLGCGAGPPAGHAGPARPPRP